MRRCPVASADQKAIAGLPRGAPASRSRAFRLSRRGFECGKPQPAAASTPPIAASSAASGAQAVIDRGDDDRCGRPRPRLQRGEQVHQRHRIRTARDGGEDAAGGSSGANRRIERRACRARGSHRRSPERHRSAQVHLARFCSRSEPCRTPAEACGYLRSSSAKTAQARSRAPRPFSDDAELQQRSGALAAFGMVGRDVQELLGGLAVAAALEIALAEPVGGVRHQPVARMGLEEPAEAHFGLLVLPLRRYE